MIALENHLDKVIYLFDYLLKLSLIAHLGTPCVDKEFYLEFMVSLPPWCWDGRREL